MSQQSDDLLAKINPRYFTFNNNVKFGKKDALSTIGLCLCFTEKKSGREICGIDNGGYIAVCSNCKRMWILDQKKITWREMKFSSRWLKWRRPYSIILYDGE